MCSSNPHTSTPGISSTYLDRPLTQLHLLDALYSVCMRTPPPKLPHLDSQQTQASFAIAECRRIDRVVKHSDIKKKQAGTRIANDKLIIRAGKTFAHVSVSSLAYLYTQPFR